MEVVNFDKDAYTLRHCSQPRADKTWTACDNLLVSVVLSTTAAV